MAMKQRLLPKLGHHWLNVPKTQPYGISKTLWIQRQTDMLNLFLDGYEAKITSKTWASLAKCSKDTAIRDIQDLVDKDILREDIPGAKRPSYSIIYDPEDITVFFSDVTIDQQNGNHYIKALYKGRLKVYIPGAKRPSYSIIYDPEDITVFFSDVTIDQQNGNHYIKALYKGRLKVCERILPLDAERFEKGDLPLENLLAKYCSYLRIS